MANETAEMFNQAMTNRFVALADSLTTTVLGINVADPEEKRMTRAALPPDDDVASEGRKKPTAPPADADEAAEEPDATAAGTGEAAEEYAPPAGCVGVAARDGRPRGANRLQLPLDTLEQLATLFRRPLPDKAGLTAEEYADALARLIPSETLGAVARNTA